MSSTYTVIRETFVITVPPRCRPVLCTTLWRGPLRLLLRNCAGFPQPEHEDETARDPWTHLGALVLRRAHPHPFGEAAAEGAETGEPDQIAHLGHREIGRAKEVGRTLDPAPRQVLHRRLAVLGGEAAQE